VAALPRQACQQGRLKALVLSVYTDSSEAEPIVLDVVVKLLPRRCETRH
jgi:hypothetical protein